MTTPDSRFAHGDHGGLYLAFAAYLALLGLAVLAGLAAAVRWALQRRA